MSWISCTSAWKRWNKKNRPAIKKGERTAFDVPSRGIQQRQSRLLIRPAVRSPPPSQFLQTKQKYAGKTRKSSRPAQRRRGSFFRPPSFSIVLCGQGKKAFSFRLSPKEFGSRPGVMLLRPLSTALFLRTSACQPVRTAAARWFCSSRRQKRSPRTR